MNTNIYTFLNRDLQSNSPVVSTLPVAPIQDPSSSLDISINPENMVDGELNGNIDIVGGFIESKGFLTGVRGWRIDALGNVEFNNGVFRGQLTAGSTTDTITLDTLTAAEAITAGQVVGIMSDGTACRVNNHPSLLPRVYGIAITNAAAGATFTCQKSGPYTTSGLTAGSFYGAYTYFSTSGYGSAVSTVTQSTRGSATDAIVGIGQTITSAAIFSSGMQLYLTMPGGAGTYGGVFRIMQLFTSEGGVFPDPAPQAVASITRSGSTATLVLTNGDFTVAAGDYVTVSGAAQTEYNGTFRILTRTVSGVGATITYAVSGTPATPATGTITCTFRYTIYTKTASFAAPNASENLYSAVSFLATNNTYQYHDIGEKIFIDFQSNTAGQININYSSSSVYSGGNMWTTGVSDVTKDMGFIFSERFGSGTLYAIPYSYFTDLDSTPVKYIGTHPTPATNGAIGLARSTTKLLIGNFNRS
jgi:hypothetical protein